MNTKFVEKVTDICAENANKDDEYEKHRFNQIEG